MKEKIRWTYNCDLAASKVFFFLAALGILSMNFLIAMELYLFGFHELLTSDPSAYVHLFVFFVSAITAAFYFRWDGLEKKAEYLEMVKLFDTNLETAKLSPFQKTLKLLAADYYANLEKCTPAHAVGLKQCYLPAVTEAHNTCFYLSDDPRFEWALMNCLNVRINPFEMVVGENYIYTQVSVIPLVPNVCIDGTIRATLYQNGSKMGDFLIPLPCYGVRDLPVTVSSCSLGAHKLNTVKSCEVVVSPLELWAYHNPIKNEQKSDLFQ